MQDPDSRIARQPPSGRRWHVIDEIDLVGLIADHAATERLCARLEACADQLPDRPAPTEIEALCDALQSNTLDHVDAEDRRVATLFAREGRDPLCHAVVKHIHDRYVACTVLAQDITAAIKAGDAGQRSVCGDTLGYMLRCFFEGCRAAMAFETVAILALAGTRLTHDARALLQHRLSIGVRV